MAIVAPSWRSVVIAHVPAIALFRAAFLGWRRWYYAEHLIVALHLFGLVTKRSEVAHSSNPSANMA
jgi:hypothetical protein